MYRKSVILIILLTCITFFNCLFNGFVGDDEFLIVKNPFYESWQRFPLLFTENFVTEPDDILNHLSDSKSHSGFNAYRPVTAVTYFLDYSIWKKNPFGYHLHNVFWHVLNAVLVYVLVFSLGQKNLAALLSALIFAVHPMKTEPVCAVSYRLDLILTFFILSGLLFYVKSTETDGQRKKTSWWLAHVCFFLAVFTKESGTIFLGLIMAYDKLIKDESWKEWLAQAWQRYAGFILILAIYLLVYVKIFPGKLLTQNGWLGGSGILHLLTVLTILGNYLLSFVFPFNVKVLPPLYHPTVRLAWNFENIQTFFVIVLFLGFLVYAYRKDKKIFFFLLWFVFGFLMVANIFPLANPMAYRFMYLPSIGFIAAAVIFLEQMIFSGIFQPYRQSVGVLTVSFLGFCIVLTILSNMAWKNNYTMSFHVYRDCPDSPVSHLLKGMSYLEWGKSAEAQVFLQQAVAMDVNDPRGYFILGAIDQDPQKSRIYFNRCVQEFPLYAHCYIGLGRNHFLSKDYEKARIYFEKSLTLSSNRSVYGYLMQIYVLTKNIPKAQTILNEAKKFLNPQEYADLLNMYDQDRDKFPVDLGI